MFGTGVSKMNVKEEKICRLCLKVAENDFKIIDEIVRKIFEVLLIRLNLDISKDPILCKDCVGIAEKCFNLKSACIEAEELLKKEKSFGISKNGAMFELTDVYIDGKDRDIVYDNFICRFWPNHLSGSDFVLLDTLMNDFMFAQNLQVLMPKMDFGIIKNSIICTFCIQDVECYIKFIENSLDVEDKIDKYLQNKDTPSSEVKLGEILNFLLKNSCESDYTRTCAIKQEKDALEDILEPSSEVYDGGLIKTEEKLDVKNEALDISETMYKLDMPYKLNAQIGKVQEAKIFQEPNNISGIQIFKCATCTYQAKHKKGLRSHMLIHKDIADVKVYKCSICTYATRHKGSLKIHMLVHKDVTEVEMYKCSICTYEAKHKGSLKTHMLIHKDNMEVEMYKCSICTYETKRKHNLNVHMLIHKDFTEVKMYKCSMCTFESKLKGTLKTHVLTHKDITEVEMTKCSMCNYETKIKSRLIRHMKLIHKDVSEVDMYKCSICIFETKRKDSLRCHMLIHKDITEIEMFKCSICTYETKRKHNLKNHMSIHKNVTEAKMYKCSMCTYETKCKRYLKSHMSIHKDTTIVEIYKCSICTYETKRKHNLKNHLSIHKDITEVEMYSVQYVHMRQS